MRTPSTLPTTHLATVWGQTYEVHIRGEDVRWLRNVSKGMECYGDLSPTPVTAWKQLGAVFVTIKQRRQA